MARTSWFDSGSNQADFGQYIEQMETWQNALADGVLDAEELQQQAQRVADMLLRLEPKLSDELHEELTAVFRELAVLYGMQRLAELTMAEKEA